MFCGVPTKRCLGKLANRCSKGADDEEMDNRKKKIQDKNYTQNEEKGRENKKRKPEDKTSMMLNNIHTGNVQSYTVAFYRENQAPIGVCNGSFRMSTRSSVAPYKAPSAVAGGSSAGSTVNKAPPSVTPSAAGTASRSVRPTSEQQKLSAAKAPSQVSAAPGSQTETSHIRQQLAQLEGLLSKERKERELAAECLAKTQKELDALERILSLRSEIQPSAGSLH